MRDTDSSGRGAQRLVRSELRNYDGRLPYTAPAGKHSGIEAGAAQRQAPEPQPPRLHPGGRLTAGLWRRSSKYPPPPPTARRAQSVSTLSVS